MTSNLLFRNHIVWSLYNQYEVIQVKVGRIYGRCPSSWELVRDGAPWLYQSGVEFLLAEMGHRMKGVCFYFKYYRFSLFLTHFGKFS